MSAPRKRPRHAGLAIMAWLLMTFFSCAALSNTSVDLPATAVVEQSSHHSMMLMPEAGHDTMPCCEQQLEQACCDAVSVLPAGCGGTQGQNAEQPDAPAAIVAASFYGGGVVSPPPVALPGHRDQGTPPSYPRLHVVNCSFQI